MCAVLTAFYVAAELSSATNLDGGHNASLGQAHVAGVGGAPCLAMESENIGYLQLRPEHVGLLTPLAPARAQHADQEARQRGSRPPPDRAAHTPPSAEPPARRATGSPRNSSVGNKSLYPPPLTTLAPLRAREGMLREVTKYGWLPGARKASRGHVFPSFTRGGHRPCGRPVPPRGRTGDVSAPAGCALHLPSADASFAPAIPSREAPTRLSASSHPAMTRGSSGLMPVVIRVICAIGGGN